jgi:hypothetical protein
MELSSKRLKDFLKGLRFFLARCSWPCVFVPPGQKTTILEIAFEFCGVFLYCLLTHRQLICRFVAPGDFVEKGLQQ